MTVDKREKTNISINDHLRMAGFVLKNRFKFNGWVK